MLGQLLTYVRETARRRQVAGEVDDELAFHLEQDIQAHVASGLSPAEARRIALRDLGGLQQTREAVRDVRMTWLDQIAGDVRQAVRGVRNQPMFALVTMLTLGLGIGGTVTMFSLLDAVLLKPLPVPNVGDLVELHEIGPEGAADPVGGTGRYLRFSYPRYQRLSAALGSYGQLAAVTRSYRVLAKLPSELTPRTTQGQLVSETFFPVLGIGAARGRVFSPADFRDALWHPTVVVSDNFWRTMLHGRGDVLGSTITMNDVELTVIGVMPAGFGGLWTDNEAQAWLPIALQQQLRYRNNSSTYGRVDQTQSWLAQDVVSWVAIVGRIPPANRGAASAALNAANAAGLADLVTAFRTEANREAMLAHKLAIEPLRNGFSGLRARFSDALLILFGLVALVLLITCANVCNLLLARATARHRELGIRRSLGASTGRLIQRDITESLLLTAAGGVFGLLLAIWGSRWMAAQILSGSTLPAVFAPDRRLLVFSIGLTILTGLLVGLVPAWHAARSAPLQPLGHWQRTTATGSTLFGMRSIVVVQLALSLPVVVASILLGRSFTALATIDPGFSVDSVISVSIDPSTAGYKSSDASPLASRLVNAATQMPGVRSAAVSRCGLIAGCATSSDVYADGHAEGFTSYQNWVTPLYFSTTGVDLVAGRSFTDFDTERSEPVAIVSESVARHFYGSAEAIGHSIGQSRPTARIVGIVRDVRSASLHEAPTAMVYFPMTQHPEGAPMPTNVDIRVSDRAGVALESFRAALQKAEPALLFDSVSTVSARLRRDLGRERLAAYTTRAFAGLTLLLTGLGLFGVLSYAVSRQTPTLGIRMALGATRSQVYRLMMRQGSTMTLIGLLAGTVTAVAAGRYLSQIMAGTGSSGGAVALSAIALAVVAFWACYLPARKATRIDPLVALKTE